MVHRVQEEAPGKLHSGALHDQLLLEKELRRTHPALLIRTAKPIDDLAKRLVQCRDRSLDRLEGHLHAMMNHAVVQKLDQILVVPDQMFDDFFGAAGLGVGPLPPAFLEDRSYDIAEESALVSQNPLQKGWRAHRDLPSRRKMVFAPLLRLGYDA